MACLGIATQAESRLAARGEMSVYPRRLVEGLGLAYSSFA
jgi:hypothetical protein